MRITNQSIYLAQQASLQTSLANLAKAQQAATSGRRITRPSDDPAGTAAALGIRSSLAQNAQYARNIGDGQAWTSAADSALSQVDAQLRKVRDLVVQASNGTMTQAGKNAIADQVDAIKSALLAQANAKVNGRSVFAGTSAAPGAFDATTYAYAGQPGSAVTRRVGDASTVRVDVDGSAVFGAGASSVFADLDALSSLLRGGGNPNGYLTTIDSRLAAVESAQADVGAAQRALQSAQTAQQAASVSLAKQRSDVEDVDTARAAIDLTNKNNLYQAALLVVANTMQTNLTDFLR